MSSLFVISGPSGSGKSTVCHRITALDENIRISVSATTREPREGEVDGVDYFFISQEEFDERVEKGEFLEHAGHFRHSYGTLKPHVDALIEQGYDVILEIDTVGAMQIREKSEDALLVFIMPPSEEILEQRLRGRKSETDEQIALRLAKAKEEMDQRDMYDYVVVNDTVDECAEEILELIRGKRCHERSLCI